MASKDSVPFAPDMYIGKNATIANGVLIIETSAVNQRSNWYAYDAHYFRENTRTELLRQANEGEFEPSSLAFPNPSAEMSSVLWDYPRLLVHVRLMPDGAHAKIPVWRGPVWFEMEVYRSWHIVPSTSDMDVCKYLAMFQQKGGIDFQTYVPWLQRYDNALANMNLLATLTPSESVM